MYMEEYRNKCVTADEAVKVINSGDWVEFAWAATVPGLIDEALARRKDELFDINLRGGVIITPMACLECDPEGAHFTWNSWHLGGRERKMVQKGQAYYIPLKYSELPRYLREDLQTDVVAIQVAPMDEHGYFNFGVTISHYAAAIEKARAVIVEVNEDMPNVHGGYDHAVHISKVDYIVEAGHRGLPILPSASASELDRQIAEYVLPEINDGACIQLGIGGMPNALGKMIAESDLKDLGIHTEMLVDGFVDMVEAGKVTGMRKQLDKGRMVYAFAAGTQKLYDFIRNNPSVAGYPVDYTNHPFIASQNDQLISINSALEIDLTGQVCSESAGSSMISGAGGQLDFVEAAYNSKGGKSFICLPSTYKDKNGQMHSRIKGLMTLGSAITDTRPTVQFVVTEYGKVNLKGLATWQRAEALISIAHPDFRESLIAEAQKLKIWRKRA
ncbi:acetyl-CoA hydrolase/transferase C-terminal domain-containing protein [Desulfosporosinus sp.]|uniref:acetyl-CoA hydrolase/transferase family protein n=1 Tax=Desulfosporosinus sp. TaxID=157907 RepID=UPI000E942395|nr:acetyl-CoA hydrolase/transferase C-terminal domain-containing protein [Desulfosporosinus sp.]MBC2723311.1 butyryl-CoA:acetate CoA-transferase [Desulfosporosinus sp.]MBC2726113.1 butyryl-CoA:acetate CoA-transferase [Desulfosporosinus sp.]HBV87512.1 butyryl-CoA:acetate CoA-transferase [Desulfosporosinus sp.]